ncbi:hypothetical protein BC937DRAFT_91030 [Endogone sp. FLAS-F59071]|nr:hypothetical protein BC937DRAFT_91030 [Endogone sp. FLAS-F59071]|eukprot:RUS16586.1 hypothetical protein BC937DRAFT_91030 [Endogone sp. FLAS-F59071]
MVPDRCLNNLGVFNLNTDNFDWMLLVLRHAGLEEGELKKLNATLNGKPTIGGSEILEDFIKAPTCEKFYQGMNVVAERERNGTFSYQYAALTDSAGGVGREGVECGGGVEHEAALGGGSIRHGVFLPVKIGVDSSTPPIVELSVGIGVDSSTPPIVKLSVRTDVDSSTPPTAELSVRVGVDSSAPPIVTLSVKIGVDSSTTPIVNLVALWLRSTSFSVGVIPS